MGVWQTSNKYKDIDHKYISEITASSVKHMDKIKEVRLQQMRLLGFDDLRQKGQIQENIRNIDGYLTKGKILTGS